jgi:arabinan endo-1,5-alpha-L-arabinosidase
VVSGGVYRITPRHSGKAVDVVGCGTANGTNVNQWSWLNNNCQKWIFTDAGSGYWRISPMNATGQGLRTNGSSAGSNVTIQGYGSGSNDRQWQLISVGSGFYQIKPRNNSNMCLDINGISTADGANVMLWNCISANQNQHFSFTPQ